MTQPTHTIDQKKGTAKRHHQWSIMIVGTQGRVIPLRRFLPVAVVASILIVIGILVIAGLSILYGIQNQQVHELQARIEKLQEKAEDLKHERDVYLAKVVIVQEQLNSLSTPQVIEDDITEDDGDSVAETKRDDGPSRVPVVDESTAEVSEKKQAVAVPAVAWGATTKDFNIDYDSGTNSLRVAFKIYNTSSPKEILSGRCVVVLKQKDDPPVKWISLPSVLMTNGEPSGDTGYAFRIKNYRTIKLSARNQHLPVEFNTASIYIYQSDGTRLYHRDYMFSIAPAAPVATPRPQPAAVEENIIPPPAAPMTAPRLDGSTLQVNGGRAQPPHAPDESSSPASSTPAGLQSIETSTTDPPASDESTGPKLEGEKQ